MAGKKPFFITGSNCKIKVNGVTLAFATDLSYSVAINHQSMKVLGLYEADTQEPLSFSINGSFTLIRYIDSITNSGGHPNGVDKRGNGIGSFTHGNSITKTVGSFSNEGNVYESLDPSKLSKSTTFDIEIYQKVPGVTEKDFTDFKFQGVTDFLQGRTSGTTRGSNSNTLGISRLRDCKITGVTANINKRGLMIQTFSFIANYVDEDSFLSSASGVGQQYS